MSKSEIVSTGSVTLTDQPALPAGSLPPGSQTRALTAAEFQGLAEVPPELEWFANIHNARTHRASRQYP